MALVFIDSFDHYTNADKLLKWTATGSHSIIGGSGTATITASAGRRGGQGLVLSGTNVDQIYLNKTLTTSGAGVVLGVAIKLAAAPPSNGTQGIFSIAASGTAQITVCINSDLTVSVRRGSNTGTVLGTSGATSISVGSFFQMEFKCLLSTTVGTYDVKLNGGSSILSGSGANTAGSGGTTWNQLWLGDIAATTGNVNVGTRTYCDLYVSDQSGSAPYNDYLGDCRVDVTRPTGAGATTNFTPSTGSNYQNVDDAQANGDTDYNSSANAGDIDTFAWDDLPVVGGTILALQSCLYIRKEDAGAATVAPVVRRSGTNYVGTAVAPSTSYGIFTEVQTADPSTSAAWTESNFNGAEFGYKKVS